MLNLLVDRSADFPHPDLRCFDLKEWRMHNAILALDLAVILAQVAQAEDWRPVELGPSPGAVKSLYVEMQTMRRDGDLRYAWVLSWFDTTKSAYRYKKELVAIDCLRNQFEGIKWVWVDTGGQLSQSDEADTRWTRTLEGSPGDSITRFVCGA